MGVDDWQLAQGTVDFRNEERRAAAGRSDTPRPQAASRCSHCGSPGYADDPFCLYCGAKDGKGGDPKYQATCPNCLADLDADGYCDGCSYLATIKRPA